MKGWRYESYRHALAARGVSSRLPKYGKTTVARVCDARIDMALNRMREVRHSLANSSEYKDSTPYVREFLDSLGDLGTVCVPVENIDTERFNEFAGASLILERFYQDGSFYGKEFHKSELVHIMDIAISSLNKSIAGSGTPTFGSRGVRRFGKIPGGMAEGKRVNIDPHQLVMGQKVEMEHTRDPEIATEISMDHLTEDPRYYTKLKKMEAGR